MGPSDIISKLMLTSRLDSNIGLLGISSPDEITPADPVNIRARVAVGGITLRSAFRHVKIHRRVNVVEMVRRGCALQVTVSREKKNIVPLIQKQEQHTYLPQKHGLL